MRLGVEAALVDGIITPGDVQLADGHIHAVGLSSPNGRGLAVPGFIDVQINGYAGVDFTTASDADYQDVALRLAMTGVTAFQPTLIALPLDTYHSTLRRFSPEVVQRTV